MITFSGLKCFRSRERKELGLNKYPLSGATCLQGKNKFVRSAITSFESRFWRANNISLALLFQTRAFTLGVAQLVRSKERKNWTSGPISCFQPHTCGLPQWMDVISMTTNCWQNNWAKAWKSTLSETINTKSLDSYRLLFHSRCVRVYGPSGHYCYVAIIVIQMIRGISNKPNKRKYTPTRSFYILWYTNSLDVHFLSVRGKPRQKYLANVWRGIEHTIKRRSEEYKIGLEGRESESK